MHKMSCATFYLTNPGPGMNIDFNEQQLPVDDLSFIIVLNITARRIEMFFMLTQPFFQTSTNNFRQLYKYRYLDAR